MIRVSGTTTTANMTVLRSATQNSGSEKVLVKLPRPTHWVGAAPVSWGRP